MKLKIHSLYDKFYRVLYIHAQKTSHHVIFLPQKLSYLQIPKCNKQAWCVYLSPARYWECHKKINLKLLAMCYKFSSFFFLKYFLLDIFFIYISNVISFPCFPSENLYPSPLALNPPTPSFWPWQPLIYGYITFTCPRASPSLDDWLCHPLLHMQLEPWVIPCVFLVQTEDS